MSSDRFTITLPKDLGAKIRKRAREQKQPVSRIIADDVQVAERERIRQNMIEGAKATAALNKQLAEEFWPIAGETWPID